MCSKKGVKKGRWMSIVNFEQHNVREYVYRGYDDTYHIIITGHEPDVFSIDIAHKSRSERINWRYHSVSISLLSAKHISHAAIRRHKRSKEGKK